MYMMELLELCYKFDFELSMGWATARLGNGLGIYETWIEAVVVAETAGDCGWRWR